eukprot:TRINITY_DN81033_c0_g1_i1.p1 TRINITY_DN81033_c0_g1~~TRINITY_DN81033_c0_g1_i1.p1  ORF type:complete len:320 (-),score=63.40 TRINITY_DN81033_c0_g1_i1:217-1176(-)
MGDFDLAEPDAALLPALEELNFGFAEGFDRGSAMGSRGVGSRLATPASRLGTSCGREMQSANIAAAVAAQEPIPEGADDILRAEAMWPTHPNPNVGAAARCLLVPEEGGPYDMRSAVGTAKYVSPKGISPRTSGSFFEGERERRSLASVAERFQGGRTKTETWREKGLLRWPQPARDLQVRQPNQFARAEEVVPLQRTTENQQNYITQELWTRSLRMDAVDMQDIGLHNQNLATSAVRGLFDRHGTGFTGKTNVSARRQRAGQFGPHTKEWVERPVAQGPLALNHMGGTRYAIDPKPRPCVPDSMAHMSPPRRPPNTAR